MTSILHVGAQPPVHPALFTGHRLLASALLGGCVLALTACGGGGDTVASTTQTAASTQISDGVVSGFGSVYVNGVKLDDSSAASLSYAADGTTLAQALRLGQQVRVEHNASGKASRVLVDAAVIGSVSSVNATEGSLVVAAQTVKVNTDSAAGPLTVFAGGYTALADVLATDLVEVHGTPVYNSTTTRYDIQATRIEKRTAVADVRVTGKLSALDTTAKTFSLNGLTVSYGTATLRPSTAVLATGQNVIVWSKTYTSGTALTASGVRVVNTSTDLPATTTARLSGVVSNVSSTGFEVAGVKVTTQTTTTVTPTGATVANAAYVGVTGVVQTDGSVLASAIQVRQSDTTDDSARIRLSGPVTSYTSDTSFVVRGVPVDATGITLATACPGVTLANGVAVNVVATAQAGTDVVLASSMTCPAAATAFRDAKGAPSAVNTTAKTFTLTTASGTTQAVQWSDTTVWGGTLTAATLSAATTVIAEGYLDSAGVLQVRELRVPGTRDSDAYDATSMVASDHGWGRYNAMKNSHH
jgi:hypothetical protein